MDDWLITGLRLTVLGMGMVFLLLALLWGLIALLVGADDAPPEKKKRPRASRRAETPPSAPGVEPELAAAIMIAVRAHIRARRKQAAPAMRAHAPGSQQSRWVSVGRVRQTKHWPGDGRLRK
jgi:sodium pump decarboxylase gamma subunit